ncbi:hypothetical protein N7448_008151 [Penicillium atrosanguineum]|uniref:Uncharacterized protein n=1 Tax=Penicillium atrosanguineum TaxID=1132637 RepID=A0A9W9GSA4_9EURO|nr:uncharacterized protein N7443_000835 [Penicillium atrosanguineum]KAJ5127372.1 hypothetical protein N7448_008151 [Penicillium atrosanguineum]KAJ5147574.1 hypothetical protein N7526_000926 [Penicillium atrosanguineum]KAJ5313951.1 hypothetical protein N7443_000835 [Penicillium atrosanguineum]KAJ5331121.1 hypothetical protein N7476_000904 [Penicillium atrosanguineum]
MLARRDQENLVNAHQTTAAAKPLNQGLKQLAPKTPGKKVPLNDENHPGAFKKLTVKGNGNRQDNGKPGNNAFVTPMEPRNRAPLGMKDTNTKARAPQTPAPFGGTLKPKTNRKTASAQRLKKAAPVTQQAQTKVYTESVQDDVPDIEYMPPKPIALPDLPDDVTYDTTFPQFQPRNRALGLESVYGEQEVGQDGLTKKQRKFQEDSIKADKLANETMMKQLESIGFNDPSEDEAAPAPKPQPRSLRSRTPSSSSRPTRSISTLRSREAAAALAAPRPSSASTRPATVPKSRIASASSILMPKKTRVPSNPSSMRATAAAATSNTTMGYSKGRSVSSTLREKTAEQPSSISATLSPETYMQLYGPPPLESDMWSRCKAAGCFDTPDEIATSQEVGEPLPTFEEDDEAESFQLTL